MEKSILAEFIASDVAIETWEIFKDIECSSGAGVLMVLLRCNPLQQVLMLNTPYQILY